MRITSQFLRSKVARPLRDTEYLDLTSYGIVFIENLHFCPKLRTLKLSGNYLQEVSNLDCCPQLWNLDLSNNKITCLDGLSKFLALGTLVLSNNNLAWKDLVKIRHIHILNLSIHGNPQLEKSPYYRIHVIDCLPNVWMLDGRIVTSAERIQVSTFFQESALTDHPVRHKLPKDSFIPTSLQKIQVNGIFGKKAEHLLTRFPANALHNIEIDKKRLNYLACDFQGDLLLEKEYIIRDIPVLQYRKNFLENLLSDREKQREKSNMLLILLLASLDFQMPALLMKDTLDTSKLYRMGRMFTIDLFLLPKETRCQVVSLLLAAVKIDKDTDESGGLYEELYLCLFYLMNVLTKLSQTEHRRALLDQLKNDKVYQDYKSLLASEVVQLFCIVPSFFTYLGRDAGIKNLVITGTGDKNILQSILELSKQGRVQKKNDSSVYIDISELLLSKVQAQARKILSVSRTRTSNETVLFTSKALPMRGHRTAAEIAEYHTLGISSPNFGPESLQVTKKVLGKNAHPFPHLGDALLLGPQTIGRVISLPEPFLALIAMDTVPVPNGAMEFRLKDSEDHYTYVNMEQFEWDAAYGRWKPCGTVGDRYTIQSVEDFQRELMKRTELSDHFGHPNSPVTIYEDTVPLIYTPRYKPMSSSAGTRRKDKQVEEMVRPISAVLKEKLDLRLSMTDEYKYVNIITSNEDKPVTHIDVSEPDKDIVHSSDTSARTDDEEMTSKKVTQDEVAHEVVKEEKVQKEASGEDVPIKGISVDVTPEDTANKAASIEQIGEDEGAQEKTLENEASAADIGEDETPAADVGEDETPAADTGKDETPAADIGENEIPKADIGEDEAPIEDAVADEAPVEDAVADEAPAEDAVVDETTVEDAVVDETPVEDAAVDEKANEETAKDQTPTEGMPSIYVSQDELETEETKNEEIDEDGIFKEKINADELFEEGTSKELMYTDKTYDGKSGEDVTHEEESHKEEKSEEQKPTEVTPEEEKSEETSQENITEKNEKMPCCGGDVKLNPETFGDQWWSSSENLDSNQNALVNETPIKSRYMKIDNIENYKPCSSDEEDELQTYYQGWSQQVLSKYQQRPYAVSRMYEKIPASENSPEKRRNPIQLAIQMPNIQDNASEQTTVRSVSTPGKLSHRPSEKDFHVRGSPKHISYPHSGRRNMPVKGRPFSAAAAYRYFVAEKNSPSESMFHSDFQHSRTEAWKKTARLSASARQACRDRTVKPTPPQRPTSPVNKGILKNPSKLHMKRTDDWLAGGRDIYWDTYTLRLRPSHTPGWKEGLPESMQRPKSAYSARNLRRLKVPATMFYEISEGHPSPNELLREVTDYHPLFQQLGLMRLGSAPYEEIVFAKPTQDIVYRAVPLHKRNEPKISACLQCLFEQVYETDCSRAGQHSQECYHDCQ